MKLFYYNCEGFQGEQTLVATVQPYLQLKSSGYDCDNSQDKIVNGKVRDVNIMKMFQSPLHEEGQDEYHVCEDSY